MSLFPEAKDGKEAPWSGRTHVLSSKKNGTDLFSPSLYPSPSLLPDWAEGSKVQEPADGRRQQY